MADTVTNSFEVPKIKGLENYRGNKYFPGAYQTIINNIPPHSTYVEPFVGSGAIVLLKKPADHTVVNDIDSGVTVKWNCKRSNHFKIKNLSAVKLLSSVLQQNTDTFVYMDPPYIIDSRFSGKAIYKFEMTVSDHEELLSMILKAKCNCMISTYENELYTHMLQSWRSVRYRARVHKHTATEVLFCNFSEPTVLHDYRYLGSNCWDRQRIKRKIHRHVQRLMSLPAVERNAILYTLSKI